jgi:hypothetical protein
VYAEGICLLGPDAGSFLLQEVKTGIRKTRIRIVIIRSFKFLTAVLKKEPVFLIIAAYFFSNPHRIIN